MVRFSVRNCFLLARRLCSINMFVGKLVHTRGLFTVNKPPVKEAAWSAHSKLLFMYFGVLDFTGRDFMHAVLD